MRVPNLENRVTISCSAERNGSDWAAKIALPFDGSMKVALIDGQFPESRLQDGAAPAHALSDDILGNAQFFSDLRVRFVFKIAHRHHLLVGLGQCMDLPGDHLLQLLALQG